ncbi:MAG: NADP-reducing hydrogenase subunit HndA [Dehalococcoidia bacterium]|nr:NADP-reducing hydrogenase subunit HndA [Chloroflexota bacterium]
MEVRGVLSPSEGKRGQLIPLLQQTQKRFGYLPEEEMVKVAELCGVTESKVFGVASFYAQFRFTPIGRNRVMVCRGTACHVQGARQILDEVKRQLALEEGETTPDLEYTLESVACIGACGLAPCLMINQEVHGRLTPKEVAEVFAARKKGGQDAP